MGDIVYLRIIGEKQGDISSGCGTYASVGNRWQVGHEDEIFAFALTNAITSTGKGVNLQGLQFCKLIDKSSPLLSNAINQNERLFIEIDGNDSNLLIVFYVQIMPDDFVMQLHRF